MGQTAEMTANTADIPRMVSDSDIATVRAISASFPEGAVAVEFGPWLGAMSVAIAPRLKLHVVDNFVWTKAHAKKVPGLVVAGESFRAEFAKNLAQFDAEAEIHVTEFADFKWDNGNIDFCVIDGPKDRTSLIELLQATLPHMQAGAKIFIKNGLNPAMPDMAQLIAHLVGHDAVDAGETPRSPSNNSIVLTLRDDGGAVSEHLRTTGDGDTGSLAQHLSLAEDHPFHLAPLAQALHDGHVTQAYDLLGKMSPCSGLVAQWQKVENALGRRGVDAEDLSYFGETVLSHHGGVTEDVPVHFHRSAALARRGHWINNADSSVFGRGFFPRIITRAFDYGYIGWPSKVREIVHGKSVLDIGCGPGLHGVGYLAAGATSYVGADPIIKLDKDRVKDLSRKTKAEFGWTPEEMNDLIPNWKVVPSTVEDLDPDMKFDLVTLHNVTEHLHGLEGAFKSAAAALKPGGKILYNHHNFYSWNGHHLPPKTVKQIDLTDESQSEMVDWGHVEYDPAPEHYIARGLNRIRLDDIIALTESYFEIELLEEIQSSENVGAGRLTDSIRARYPSLTDRDFLTQNLFCLARVKS